MKFNRNDKLEYFRLPDGRVKLLHYRENYICRICGDGDVRVRPESDPIGGVVNCRYCGQGYTIITSAGDNYVTIQPIYKDEKDNTGTGV